MTALGYRIVKSIFRYFTQSEGGVCHDIHDNIWEYDYESYDTSAHMNTLECNSDYAGGTGVNVFYNNIVRHDDPSFGSNVHIWFDPNSANAEYWFNNVVYDLTSGNWWDVDGSGGGGAGQSMFNNTLEEGNGNTVDCAHSPHMAASNNHFITEGSSGYAGAACTHSGDVTMTHSTANSQGYTSASSHGTVSATYGTCADDTTPCTPTAANDLTVGAGTNWQSYCTALSNAGMTDAAAACQNDTTTACYYDDTNHVMNCPARTVNARGGKWDAGAYEFNAQDPPPNPPTGLAAVVH
jgi:hypothetical protein